MDSYLKNYINGQWVDSIGGTRHLVWDVGHGFDLKDVEMGARLTLAGSIILTVIVWAIALGVA